MIGLVQRVNSASVSVNGKVVGSISKGTLLLLGIEKDDNEVAIVKLAKKVANLRIFEDKMHKMNLSLLDIKGEILVISQFTLVADTSKGNRPGFSNAASPELAQSVYEQFVEHFSQHYQKCETGEFAANMQVSLVNDGPATFVINS